LGSLSCLLKIHIGQTKKFLERMTIIGSIFIDTSLS
jgi:hypothetical protein